MDKDVIISLCGRPGAAESIELVTPGRYCKKDGKYFITYEESSLTGMEGTTTTLQVEGKKVTLTRTGQNNSQMIFEVGKKHISCYETPFGAIVVGVQAKNIAVDINECGGEISAGYMLEVDNDLIGNSDFHMRIREA